jgi:hypothetical protein
LSTPTTQISLHRSRSRSAWLEDADLAVLLRAIDVVGNGD